LLGYGLAYIFMLRKHGLSTAQLADIIAPCAAIGLCLGRVGCLLNGCCYGNVATCAHCPALAFPLSAPSRLDSDKGLVAAGLQTAAGFTVTKDAVPPRVDRVDPDSPAYAHGLRDSDTVLTANGNDLQYVFFSRDAEQDNGPIIPHQFDNEESYRHGVEEARNAGNRVIDPLTYYLVDGWKPGKTDLTLTVRHRDGQVEQVGPFFPKTLGLHPTQVYESISMLLLFFLLTAYYPFRRHYGEVMALWMICYPIHRFFNEILRNDTDAVAFGMTLSQNLSIVCVVAGVVLFVWLRRQPAQVNRAPAGSEMGLALAAR
jgi:phosphatidylglycerol:prolipoprotein diacylglycerol transferase